MNEKQFNYLVYFVKGFTGSVGTAMIMTKQYPILTVVVLGIGAGAYELLMMNKDKIQKQE